MKDAYKGYDLHLSEDFGLENISHLHYPNEDSSVQLSSIVALDPKEVVSQADNGYAVSFSSDDTRAIIIDGDQVKFQIKTDTVIRDMTPQEAQDTLSAILKYEDESHPSQNLITIRQACQNLQTQDSNNDLSINDGAAIVATNTDDAEQQSPQQRIDDLRGLGDNSVRNNTPVYSGYLNAAGNSTADITRDIPIFQAEQMCEDYIRNIPGFKEMNFCSGGGGSEHINGHLVAHASRVYNNGNNFALVDSYGGIATARYVITGDDGVPHFMMDSPEGRVEMPRSEAESFVTQVEKYTSYPYNKNRTLRAALNQAYSQDTETASLTNPTSVSNQLVELSGRTSHLSGENKGGHSSVPPQNSGASMPFSRSSSHSLG